MNPQIDGESMLLDFDGWLNKQDADTQSGITNYLQMVPEGGRDVEKKRFASMHAVASATGLEASAVSDQWDLIRGGFAEQQGWQDQKDDEGAFYLQLRQRAQNQRDERGLIRGAESEDEEGRASRANSLVAKIFNGAALGKNTSEIFADWQKSASGKPGYDAAKADDYVTTAIDLHEQARSNLEPVLPLAQEAFSRLATDEGLEQASEVMFPRISELGQDQRRNFLAALRIVADSKSDKERATFWKNFTKSASRDVAGLARGAADYGSFLRNSYAATGSMFLNGFDAPETNAKFTEAFTALGEHNLESDIRRVQRETYDPVRDLAGSSYGKIIEHGVYAAPGAVASSLMAAVPVVGLPSMFGAMTTDSYDSIRSHNLDAGMTEADATKAALAMAPVAAAPQAILEKVGAEAVFGRLPYFRSAMTRLGDKLGGGAAGFAGKSLAIGVAETTTEMTQNLMQPVVESAAAALDKDLPGVVWTNGRDGVFDGFWSQTAETFVSMFPLALVGAATNGPKRVEQAAQASDLALRAFGAKVEDITAFRAATEKGVASGAHALDKLIENRDPNSADAKAAVVEFRAQESERTARNAAVEQSLNRDAGVVSITRGQDGWQVAREDGTRIVTSSAQAASVLRDNLAQVSSQKEADALVSIVDEWAAKPGAKDVTFTGETVKSDGASIVATRDGQVTREIKDAASLDAIYEEARMDAVGTTDAINVLVNGSNTLEFRERVADGAREIVQRLEVNQSASAALTFLHEAIEANWREGVASGRITREETVRAIAGVAPVLDPLKARDAEERAFRERVQRVAAGKGSETELRETLSELAVADAIGRRRDGARMPVGSITAAVDAAIRNAVDASEAKLLGTFRAFLRAAKQYFRAVLGTVAALRKAKSADFDRLIGKLTGFDEQYTHDAALADDIEYIAPSPEEEADGMAFSLSNAIPRERLAAFLKSKGVRRVNSLEAQTTKKNAIQQAGIFETALQALGLGAGESHSSSFRSSYFKIRPSTNDEVTQDAIDRIEPYNVRISDHERQLSARLNHNAPDFDTSVHGSPMEALLDAWAHWSYELQGRVYDEFVIDADYQGSLKESRTGDASFSSGKKTNPEQKDIAGGDTPAPRNWTLGPEGQKIETAALITEDGGGFKTPLSAVESAAPTLQEDARLADRTTAATSRPIRGQSGSKEVAVKSFSLSPGKRLEVIQKRIDGALARDPERRRTLAREMSKKLQSLQFDWETMRYTGKGDAIRPLVDPRTTGSLDKEQAFREAARREELEAAVYAQYGELLTDDTLTKVWSGPVMSHLKRPGSAFGGRLMSKSEALSREWFDSPDGYDGIDGVPRYVFGGSIAPDEMAQELFEAGLIKDASLDVMWDAIRSEVATVARYREFLKSAKQQLRDARNTAKEEFAEWRREQDAMQAKDYAPRARLVREMRTLDAILSVLPPEVRGKVGGFVKLAQLGTDASRLKEIGRRIGKMSDLVEKFLQKETTAALDKLIERAQPDREGGKQSRGKIGAEAHRYFDGIAAVRDLTPEQVEGQRAAIATAYAAPTLTNEQAADLFEREQLLDAFGAWDTKNAADMDAAFTAAREVYQVGRNERRAIEERRLADVQDMAAEVVKALGSGRYAGSQEQKAASDGLLKKLSNLNLDIKSFAETLDALLGAGHPLAQRWNQAAHEGFAQRNDEIRALRVRWKSALESATGKTGLESWRALWSMSNEQTITFDNEGQKISSTEVVPLDVIDSWADGASPDALGISPEEAAALTAERAAMEADDRRQGLPLSRVRRGAAEPVKITEAEALFVTMLAGQEEYTAALDTAGFTADAVASIEKQLSDAAKKLREFMRNEYRDGYAPLASIFEGMFGVALPQIKNYAPAAFYHQGAERAKGPDESASPEGGFRAGMLLNRKRHAAAPKLENAFATFFGHANQTAHWKGLAEMVREISGVMGKPEVKQAIAARHGDAMQRNVSAWIKSLEGNGIQKASGEIDSVVSMLSRVQSYVYLGYNLGTLMKQAPAILGSAYRIGLRDYARGLGKLLSGQLDVKTIYDSPLIQRRIDSGYSPEVRSAMRDAWNQKPTRRAQFVEFGMELPGLVDALFTTGSAAIAFDHYLQEAKAAGLTDDAARAAAMRETEDVVNRTAQPADVIDRSLFEQRLSPWGRLAFLFASEARQKASLTVNAWGNVLTGKATADDARVLFISHVVVGTMIQAITSAWRDANNHDDDEIFDFKYWNPRDFLLSIIAGPLSGLPLVRDAIGALSGFHDDGILGRQLYALYAGKKLLFDSPKDNEPEKAEWYLKKVVQVARGLDAFTGQVGNIVGQVSGVIRNFTPDSPSEAAKKKRAAQAAARREAREK